MSTLSLLPQVTFPAPTSPLPVAQRFIILVPDHPTSEVQLARAIWELTHRQQTSLIFITLVTRPAQAWRARRRLATLAALTRDRHSPVETRLATDNWLKAIQALWLPGDVVLCHAEQTLAYEGKRQRLAEVLTNRYQMAVYVFTGFYPNLDQPALPRWLREVIFYGVAVALLLGFLFLQVALQRLTTAWLSQVLLAGSAALECGVLALWHAYMFEAAPAD